MSAMNSEQFFLKWNNFESNLASGFADLLQREAMVDVTLAAEGKIIQAHKIILSICSSYFRNMFQVNPCQHPIVVLKDVRYQELTDMLDFMYKGEANVRQEDLPSFLKLAETLEIKGLAGNPGELDENTMKNNFTESQFSNLAQDSSSFVRDGPINDFLDKDLITARKKTKRCMSPLKYAESKDLIHSSNIKLESEECDNNFIRNSVNNCGRVASMKEERLSDISVDSYGENRVSHENLDNEKNAGPSSLDENSDTMPQDFVFRFNSKRVPIWEFYNVDYNCEVAVCKICQKIIKTRRIDGTRNVLSHMKHLHPSQYTLALWLRQQWKLLKDKPDTQSRSRVNQEVRPYSFVESCFGRHLLVLGGFSYRRRSSTSGRSYWFCCKPKCPAKVILNATGDFQETNSKHNHKPDLENIRRKEKLVELKKLALQVNVPGRELLQALDIKDDIKKHLNFIRTCRSRERNRNSGLISAKNPLNVGLNYKLLPSRISSKELLLHSGYLFRQDSVNPGNEKCKYWRCRVKKCKARAKTDDVGNLTILKPLHSHPSEKNEEASDYCSQLFKNESSTLLKLMEEKVYEGSIRSINPKKLNLKVKKQTYTQMQDKTDEESIFVEETNPPTASETFSFEKLMAETLADSYCDTTEINESLNLLKSD